MLHVFNRVTTILFSLFFSPFFACCQTFINTKWAPSSNHGRCRIEYEPYLEPTTPTHHMLASSWPFDATPLQDKTGWPEPTACQLQEPRLCPVQTFPPGAVSAAQIKTRHPPPPSCHSAWIPRLLQSAPHNVASIPVRSRFPLSTSSDSRQYETKKAWKTPSDITRSSYINHTRKWIRWADVQWQKKFHQASSRRPPINNRGCKDAPPGPGRSLPNHQTEQLQLPH